MAEFARHLHSVPGFLLMAKGEDVYDILGLDEPIQRDVPRVPERDHQFAQLRMLVVGAPDRGR